MAIMMIAAIALSSLKKKVEFMRVLEFEDGELEQTEGDWAMIFT